MARAYEKSANLGRCYISGPISGRNINDVSARFERVADSLARRGYLPVNPLNNGLPDGAAWEEHLAADIVTLIRCHAVYMMSDWQQSHGARLEHALAIRCGIHIIYEEDFDK